MPPATYAELLSQFQYRRSTRRLARWAASLISDIMALTLTIWLMRQLQLVADVGIFTNVYTVLAMGWLARFGLLARGYSRQYPFWDELGQLLQGVFWFTVIGMGITQMANASQVVTVWLWTAVLLLLLLFTLRHGLRGVLRALGLWYVPTIVFGNGENAVQAVKALRSEPSMGFDVKAFGWPVLPSQSHDGAAPTITPALPCLPWSEHPDDLSALRHCRCVIALEAEERELRDALIRQLARHQITNVHVIPAMRGVPLDGLDSTHFFSHEVLMIHVGNRMANPLYRISKRAFDVLGSACLLLLLSPLFVWLAYQISKDGGQPFFGHSRIGKDGKPFKCYKFRSMVVNSAEVLKHLLATDPAAKAEWDRDFKLKNDPRISPLGHWIRKTSIDELPQLWNVFKGEMSLVGPRPVVQDELERYGDDVVFYLMTKPGMTGLWQVSGRNDVDYATRVYLDSWYVKNWSLWTDIAILFKTIKVVTASKGAY